MRGEQSDELLDRRMLCLDRRLDELRATVAALSATPGVEVASHALDATLALTPIDRCADTAALLDAWSPFPADPSGRGGRSRDAERELERGRALRHAGQAREAESLLQQVAGRARATRYSPLIATALDELARASNSEGGGEALLHEALGAAARRARRPRARGDLVGPRLPARRPAPSGTPTRSRSRPSRRHRAAAGRRPHRAARRGHALAGARVRRQGRPRARLRHARQAVAALRCGDTADRARRRAGRAVDRRGRVGQARRRDRALPPARSAMDDVPRSGADAPRHDVAPHRAGRYDDAHGRLRQER